MSASSLAEPRKRSLWRLLQFRLRTLLVLPLLVACGLVGYRAYLHARAGIAPTMWDVGTGQNIKWSVPLGTLTFGAPVVAGGRIYVGTNNGYAPKLDGGVLMCLRADDGQILWLAKSPRHPAGRAYDHPLYGISSSPAVEGNRLWYVTNRCEVVCLDTEGFGDQENDGFIQDEPRGEQDPDIVWSCNMFRDLGVRPHQLSRCSPAIDDQRVFVVTGNGVSEDHVTNVSPQAPSFLALDKRTGKVLWSDSSPGENILHGQWGSPVYAVLGGVPQVIFPGGDGWLYSFDPAGTPEGKSQLLWKFDINPKDTIGQMGGFGPRNEQSMGITVDAGRVYATCAQDPEHGEGQGRIWCLDPTRRGDVSAELVLNRNHPGKSVPARRLVAVDKDAGDYIAPNPNSAVVWRYEGFDENEDGKLDFDETMHRSLGGVAIQDGTLLAADYSGLVHCLDADTGQPLWIHDCQAACWTAPLISGGHAYVCDEDGDVAVFSLPGGEDAAAGSPVATVNMRNAIYARPVVANRVLYVATRNMLYAIAEPGD